MMKLSAQTDTSYLTVNSMMTFISEIDYSQIVMDAEGNQYDHYDNYIVINNKGKELKIPYDNNYTFWDEYDENMNVKKKFYKVVIKVFKCKYEEDKCYQLHQVFDGKTLIYDATKRNPFKP